MPRGFISTRFVFPCEIIGPAHFIEFMYCRLEHATLLRVDVFHGVTLCKCAILISRPWTSVCAWNGESKPIFECAYGMVCAQTFFSRGICIAAAKIVNGTCLAACPVYCCCGRLQSAHVLCSSWECTRGAFTLLLLVVITSQLSICICEHFHVLPVPCPLMYRGRASRRCYFLCVYSNVMKQVGRASLLRRRRTTYNLCRQTRHVSWTFIRFGCEVRGVATVSCVMCWLYLLVDEAL
jgi:hypothetical protein